MPVIETGTIQSGAINLDHALSLPDGQRVIVQIESATGIQSSTTLSPPELLQLGFIGQWADRSELGRSEDYVRQEREQWSSRLSRGG